MFCNKTTGTRPTIFHAPGLWDGSRNNLFQRIVDYCLKQPVMVAEDIEVVTWNNRAEPCVLERILARGNQPHAVLGKGIQNWRHSFKTPLTLAHLEKSRFKYTMALDGYDLAYYGDLHRAAELMDRLGHALLFNGDYYIWPCWPLNTPRHLEQFQDSLSGSKWRYLNAGAWVARTEYAIEVLRKHARLQAANGDHNEQYTYHFLFRDEHPRMGIDYNCEVFQTELRDEILSYPGQGQERSPRPDRPQRDPQALRAKRRADLFRR